MDPITIIATATALAKATGLDQTIGRWFGGDNGAAVAGQVVNAAQALTGGKTPEEIIAAINQNDQLAQELRLKVMDLADKEAQRDADDRASARDMQKAALGQDDLFSKRFVYLFAAAWSIFAMGYLLMITLISIQPENQRFADTILGFLLGTIISTIVSYFFGSSRSSHGKDANINALVETVSSKLSK